MRTIILASKSPRRKELIRKLGIKFKVVPSDYKEDMNLKLKPEELARFLSLNKAKSVAQKHKDAIIIAADTFIVLKGKLLGKPHKEIKAKEMLRELSGKSHFIITGFTIIDSKNNKIVSKTVRTKVYVKKLTSKDIDTYVKSKEPLDKAGAYAIQGLGKSIIKKIEGDYFNVVGLPIYALAENLRKFGTKTNTKKLTKYKDINNILELLKRGLLEIFRENLVGFYLTGSLSYDDFNPKRSDIDLVAIIKIPASQKKIKLLKRLHLRVESKNKKWAKRVECSYVPIRMLKNVLPPKTPRPYVGEGIFYPKAKYGNEWLINQYLLYKYALPIFGPNFKKLIKSVNIKDVQKACIRDLFKEWQPKIKNKKYLNNSHCQSYVVLNLCRILYTVIRGEVASKKISASWVKNQFTPEWSKLIKTAENWQYGQKMNMRKETEDFIKFVIDKVKKFNIKVQ